MNGHWSDLLLNLSISLMGGLVKALTSGTKKKKYSHYVISAVIGGFAGVLTFMLCSEFNCSWQLTAFATGIAGYMGDSILQLFSEFLPKLLSGKINITIANMEKEKSKKDE